MAAVHQVDEVSFRTPKQKKLSAAGPQYYKWNASAYHTSTEYLESEKISFCYCMAGGLGWD